VKIGFFLPNATFDLPGTPEVGGIETFAFLTGEALQLLGHEVVLFGGRPKPGRSHRATTLPLELFDYWETQSIPDLGTRFQRLVQRVHFGWASRQVWQRHRFDAAILAKPFDWPVACYWKRRQPSLKVIMGFHGTDFFAGDRHFFSSVDSSFAVSAQVAALARQRVGVDPELIPNPADLDFFTPGENAQRKPGDSFHLVSSGRLVGWKGFSVLIEAIRKLHSQATVTCSIAGDGPERRKIEQEIAAAGLQDRVRLTGRLEQKELRQLLRAGDAFVAPSIGLEAFSIAALEGGAVGLPLLLSDRVGLADFLDAADYMAYSHKDGNALGAGIQKMIDRNDNATWVDRAARHQRMQARFAPKMVAQKIVNLIQSI
jgi:glycosyltransferase involved in cell wall biosynthesis